MIHSALVAYLSLEIGLLFLGEEGGKGILFGLVFSLFCRVGIFFYLFVLCLVLLGFSCLGFFLHLAFPFPLNDFLFPRAANLIGISALGRKRGNTI